MIRIAIEDPANRLPEGSRSLLPSQVSGVLLVPDRGVPVHPDSVLELAKRMEMGKPLQLVPEVPVASELGLPAWEPVLVWLPGTRLGRWARRLLGAFEGLERVIDSGPASRVHYFGRHYAALAPRPLQVSVVVSNACNLACVMCPYHSPAIRATHRNDYFERREFMSFDMMDAIASQCGEQRIPVKIGNVEEPLLHPRILDFVRLCRERGVPSVHITTNGTPLTEKRIVSLLDAGVTSIYVSIDASRPDTYRRIRGGDLERVESAVRNLLRIRKELGRNCAVMTAFVKNEGVSTEEVDEFRERWVREADGVILYNLVEYEEGASHVSEIHDIVDARVRDAGGRWACLNPFQELYILPDGRSYYCCETIGKLAFEDLEHMGRFPEHSLLEIWSGPAFEALRCDLLTGELEDRPACRDCGIWMAHVTATEKREGREITRNMITEIVRRT